jgi:phosphatidate cytidylyltransferase
VTPESKFRLVFGFGIACLVVAALGAVMDGAKTGGREAPPAMAPGKSPPKTPTVTPELKSRLVLGFGIATLVVAALCGDAVRESHAGVLVLGIIGVLLGCREFARLARAHAHEVQLLPMMAVSVALVIDGNISAELALGQVALPGWLVDRLHAVQAATPMPVAMVVLGLGLGWVMVAQMVRHATTRFFSNVGATILGMVYLGVTCHLLQRLALLEGTPDYYGGPLGNPVRGGQLLLLFVAATKLGDVTAYFGGKAFGRHKMTPAISPGKTWEGFAFSFVGAIGGSYAVAALIAHYAHMPAFNGWWQPFVWGLVLGPFGVAGDLAESCMKRDAAVKDSGHSMGGFGGFLDIFDALVLAAPVAYVLGVLL